jgi:hypothetical protein
MGEGGDAVTLLSIASELTTTLTSLKKQSVALKPEETSSLFFHIDTGDVTRGISGLGIVYDDSLRASDVTAAGDGLRCVGVGGSGKFVVSVNDGKDGKERSCGGKGYGDMIDVEVETGVQGGGEGEGEGMHGEGVHGVRKVDNGDCTYAVEYTVPHTARGRGGQGRVSVRVKGEHILGSPFTVKIVEGVIPRPEELVLRRKWGGSGSGNGQFSSPHDLAVTSSGEVFFCVWLNHPVQLFNSKGQFLRTQGSEGPWTILISLWLPMMMYFSVSFFPVETGATTGFKCSVLTGDA